MSTRAWARTGSTPFVPMPAYSSRPPSEATRRHHSSERPQMTTYPEKCLIGAVKVRVRMLVTP